MWRAAADAMGALCTMLERIAALEKAWMIIFTFRCDESYSDPAVESYDW